MPLGSAVPRETETDAERSAESHAAVSSTRTQRRAEHAEQMRAMVTQAKRQPDLAERITHALEEAKGRETSSRRSQVG